MLFNHVGGYGNIETVEKIRDECMDLSCLAPPVPEETHGILLQMTRKDFEPETEGGQRRAVYTEIIYLADRLSVDHLFHGKKNRSLDLLLEYLKRVLALGVVLGCLLPAQSTTDKDDVVEVSKAQRRPASVSSSSVLTSSSLSSSSCSSTSSSC